MAEVMEVAPSAVPPNDRRRNARLRVRSLIYAELERDNGGIVLDASEDGISVQAVVALTEDVLPRMRLKLPKTNKWLETRARVVWRQDSGKVAGLQFEELPDGERDRIREWLSKEAEESEHKAAANDSTPAELAPAETSKPQNDKANVDGSALEGGMGATSAVPANSVTCAAQVDKSDDAGAGSSNSVDGLDQSTSGASGGSLAPIEQTPASVKTNTRVVGGAAKHPLPAPITTPAPELAQPKFARVESGSAAPIYLLLLILAVLSATSGWAAGQGKFRPVTERLHKLLARDSAEGPVMSLRDEQPPPPVKEIEIVGTDSQDRTISLLSAPEGHVTAIPQAGTATGAAQTGANAGMNFQVWTLTPPKASAAASNAGAAQTTPPAVDNIKAGQDLAPVGSGIEPTEPVALPRPQNMTGVLKRGALIHRVEPEYPEIAKQQGISGTVALEVTVGVDGVVRDVRVISGPKLLIHAALDAVRQWRYAPTLLDGKAIETHVEISLLFHLPNGAF